MTVPVDHLICDINQQPEGDDEWGLPIDVVGIVLKIKGIEEKSTGAVDRRNMSLTSTAVEPR